MYKAIIFDLGNVLLQISHQRIVDYWSKVSGKHFDATKMNCVIKEERKLETGEISAAVFRRNVTTLLEIKLSDAEFDAGWNNIFLGTYPGIEIILKQLKPHYRLVGLSNTNQIHALKWQNDYPEVLGYFEKFFSSHEIGARKPEPAAFNIVLNYLQLPPTQVVFIDDFYENIVGALKLGITGVWMKSLPQLTQDLVELGIELSLGKYDSGAVDDVQAG